MLPFFAAPVKHCERPVLGLAPYEEAVRTPEKHEPSTVGANPTTQDTTPLQSQDRNTRLPATHRRSFRRPSCVALGPCACENTRTLRGWQNIRKSCGWWVIRRLCGPWPLWMPGHPINVWMEEHPEIVWMKDHPTVVWPLAGWIRISWNVVRHDDLPCWDVHTMKSYPSRRIWWWTWPVGFQVSLKTVSKLDFLRKRAGDPIERAVIVAVPATRRTSQDTKVSDTSNHHEAVCGRRKPCGHHQ